MCLFCIRIKITSINWGFDVTNTFLTGSTAHRHVNLHLQPSNPQLTHATLQIQYSCFLNIIHALT
jgi:hypothetical protein